MTFDDVTDRVAILSLQGPSAKDLMAKVMAKKTSSGLDGPDFPFSTWKNLELGCGVECKVFRLTYVGEPGYELHLDNKDCGRVLEALVEAKQDLVREMLFDLTSPLHTSALMGVESIVFSCTYITLRIHRHPSRFTLY